MDTETYQTPNMDMKRHIKGHQTPNMDTSKDFKEKPKPTSKHSKAYYIRNHPFATAHLDQRPIALDQRVVQRKPFSRAISGYRQTFLEGNIWISPCAEDNIYLVMM